MPPSVLQTKCLPKVLREPAAEPRETACRVGTLAAQLTLNCQHNVALTLRGMSEPEWE